MNLEEIKTKLINKETISYFITGVLTTAVDYVSFALVNEFMQRSGDFTESFSVMSATFISWMTAVIFAYVTNKYFVFESKGKNIKETSKEAFSFFICRVASGVISMFLMWICIDIFFINEYIGKILISIFNLVFNYIVSKLWVFKKEK